MFHTSISRTPPGRTGRSLFSKPLFLLTLHRTLPHGIASLSAGVLLSVLALLVSIKNDPSNGELFLVGRICLTAVSLLAPLFVFTAFSHLFSKQKSDFFESLPQSKISFACSALLACLFWQVLAMLATLCVLAVAPFFTDAYRFSDLFSSAEAICDLFLPPVNGLYVLALSFLAVSLCGRLESALFMLLVLMAVPSMLAWCANTMILDGVLPLRYLPILSHIGCPTLWLILSEELPYYGLHPLAGILTPLLEIPLILLLGLFVFHRRKSECAQKVTVHPVITRILLALLSLTPFLIYQIFAFGGNIERVDSFMEVYTQFFQLTLHRSNLYLLLISLPIFLVTELIYERRLLNMAKGALCYLLILGALFGFATLGCLTAYTVQKNPPKAESIKRIEFHDLYYADPQSPYDAENRNIQSENQEIIDRFSEHLTRSWTSTTYVPSTGYYRLVNATVVLKNGLQFDVSIPLYIFDELVPLQSILREDEHYKKELSHLDSISYFLCTVPCTPDGYQHRDEWVQPLSAEQGARILQAFEKLSAKEQKQALEQGQYKTSTFLLRYNYRSYDQYDRAHVHIALVNEELNALYQEYITQNE